MSKFVMCDVVRRLLPSNTEVGEPMIVKGYIHSYNHGENRVVCVGGISRKAMMYSSKSLVKEPTIKVIIKDQDLTTLEKMHGIGVFYHNLSKTYDRIYDKKPKWIVFIHTPTGKRLIYHLAKAEKVIKTIGYEHNGNYQQQRVGYPMVKLTFIGDIS